MATIYIECESCGWEGKLDDGLIGRRIKCKQCGTSFVAEVGGSYTLQQAEPPTVARGPDSPKATKPSRAADKPDEEKTIDGVQLKDWLDRWPEA